NSWLFGFDEDEEATSVAGFAILPPDVGHETPHILAIEPLRDFAVIYTNWSAWQLQFVGAPFIFVRRRVQQEWGLGTWDCCVNLGDRHLVWASDGDFYEFNG